MSLGIDIPVDGLSLSGILSAAAAIVGSILVIRKRISRDSLEMIKDRAEINVIHHLENQRDAAIKEKEELETALEKAEADSSASAAQVASLSSEITRLTGQVMLLRQLIERLSNSLDETKQKLVKLHSEKSEKSS